MKEAENKRIDVLRRQAEALLAQDYQSIKLMKPEDVHNLIHELNVHQMELEIQNEELRRSQAEIEESRNRYSDLFDFAPVGYFTLDQNGFILEVNLAGADLLGTRRRALIKAGFSDFIAPIFQDRFFDHRKQVFATKAKQSCELKLLKKDGTSLYAQLESIAAQDDKRNFNRVRTAVMDLSERKKNEEEKEKLHEQIRQSQKMEVVGTLAGGIAHDLNNLHQPILVNTQLMLLELKKGNPFFNKLKDIETASTRAIALIRRLLAFGRRIESFLSMVDLNHQVNQVKKLLARSIPNIIGIEFQLADDLKNIQADPNQIEQVIMNLAINARNAMPEGGKLTITTKNIIADIKNHPKVKPGDYVLLTVSDNGCGMNQEAMEHIFEPFYSTKGMEKGTGLGLSMVYGIVTAHHGYIDCTSDPGQGTTFRIYWPATEEKIKPKEIKNKLSNKGGTETVLAVDDEESILSICREILQKTGYRVLTAADGETALKLCRREHIDLVLLDLNLPGIGGKQCLKELFQINARVKAIITSGYFSEELYKEIVEAGAGRFLKKPYNIDQLVKTVREVLDEKSW